MMKKHILIFAVVMCGVFICAPRADATLITISVTAEVTGVGDPGGVLEGRINVDDIITGTYTYDTSTPDLNPDPTVGRYEHYDAPCGVSLNVGGFVFRTDPDNVDFLVEIKNNFLAVVPYDSFKWISENNLPLSNDVLIDYISLELQARYPSLDALSSDALPTTALVVDDWEIGGWNLIVGGMWKPDFYLRARLTSAIPEPATFLLLGFGGLALLRNRRTTKAERKA